MPPSARQASEEALPGTPSQNSEPEAALLAEEVKILRKLAAVQKRWWQDYSLLVAGMAFLLSLTTSIISARTSYRKDIHDQQAQLATLTQSLRDLSLQQVELPNKYKELSKDNPLVYQGIVKRYAKRILQRFECLAHRRLLETQIVRCPRNRGNFIVRRGVEPASLCRRRID